MESSQPRFVDGRNVGSGSKAALRSHRVSFDIPAPHLRKRIGWGVDHKVDLLGEKVLHRRAGAAIRHQLNACAGLLVEKHAEYMSRGADPLYSQGGLPGVCLEP